jgi:heat shock protein HslJ
MMIPPALVLAALVLLAACKEQRQQLSQALSGKPPVIAGSLEGAWQGADLPGGGAPANIAILFDPGDQNSSRVTGTSGCNRFAGNWRQDGAALSLGPLASTRRLCADAVMDTERRLLSVLASAARVTYLPGGDAVLSAADGRKLTLRRPPTP